jgi:hypothetical protein
VSIPEEEEAWQNDYIQEANRYRSAWMAFKIGLYAAFISFDGIVISVCSVGIAFVPQSSKGLLASLIFLSVVSSVLVVVNFRHFISTYDALGFKKTPQTAKDREDYDKYYRKVEAVVQKRGIWRRRSDCALYAIFAARALFVVAYLAKIVGWLG